MEKYEFGTRVAQLRKIKGITQAQLAEILNVSNKTISRWETGDGYPDISLLKPLARALDVSIDYLLGNEAQNRTHNPVEESGVQKDSKENVIRDMPFDWRHPRWKDLTPLNKVAAATLLVMILYNVSWWILAAFTSFEVINIFVVLNAFFIKYLPITGIICTTVSLVRGEKGLSFRQSNVSRALFAGNLIVPLVFLAIMFFGA